MLFSLEFPCGDPNLPADNRVAINEAGRLACDSQVIAQNGTIDRHRVGRAAAMARQLAARDPNGPYAAAEEILAFGGPGFAAAIQCARNRTFGWCLRSCGLQDDQATLPDSN
jgi:hypothetical protein